MHLRRVISRVISTYAILGYNTIFLIKKWNKIDHIGYQSHI